MSGNGPQLDELQPKPVKSSIQRLLHATFVRLRAHERFVPTFRHKRRVTTALSALSR
jgi:hypothetical protein